MRHFFSLFQLASAAALGLMVVIVTLEVAMRFLFGNTWQLSPEFAGYSLVAMTFLGMAGTYRGNHLMRIEIFYDEWSPSTRRVLSIVFEVATLVAVLTATWFSWRFAFTSFTRGTVAPTLYSTPVWIPQMLIPLGLALLSLAIVIRLVQTIRGTEDA